MSKVPSIAVVDDEGFGRGALPTLLRSAGIAVETFPCQAKLLQSLQAQGLDCIVLDLHVPGVTGFEVQELRGKPEPNKGVPL